MSLTGTVIVNGELNFGDLNGSVNVSGTLSGSASVDHIVQDALIAEEDPNLNGGQPTPVAALTVRPHTSANLTWGNTSNGTPAVNLYVQFQVTLPFVGPLTWQWNLLSVPPFTVAKYDSDSDPSSPTGRAWPESGNLRLGTWSPIGSNVTTQPTVDSRLPGATASFLSFPGVDSVNYCLNSDTSQNNPVPPACPATPPQGAPSATNLCVYAYALSNSTQVIPNACSNLSAWAQAVIATTGMSQYLSATDANLLSLLSQLCTKVSNGEDSSGRVSHLLAGTDQQTIGNTFNLVLTDAANNAQLNGVGKNTAKAFLQNWASTFLLFGACDANANLIGASQVLSQVTGTNVPTVAPGGACN